MPTDIKGLDLAALSVCKEYDLDVAVIVAVRLEPPTTAIAHTCPPRHGNKSAVLAQRLGEFMALGEPDYCHQGAEENLGQIRDELAKARLAQAAAEEAAVDMAQAKLRAEGDREQLIDELRACQDALREAVAAYDVMAGIRQSNCDARGVPVPAEPPFIRMAKVALAGPHGDRHGA